MNTVKSRLRRAINDKTKSDDELAQLSRNLYISNKLLNESYQKLYDILLKISKDLSYDGNSK